MHIAHMGGTSSAYKILIGNYEGRSLVEDIGVDGRVILKWILRNSVEVAEGLNVG